MRRGAVLLGVALAALATASARGYTTGIDEEFRRRHRPARGAKRAMLLGVKTAGQPWMQLLIAGYLTKRLRRDHVAGANAILASVATAFVCDRVGKRLVLRDRPPRYGGKTPNESFPSGHTAAAAALTLSLARVLEARDVVRRPRATLGALVVTACMAESRLALDEHWITDVLGGALLGSTAASVFAP